MLSRSRIAGSPTVRARPPSRICCYLGRGLSRGLLVEPTWILAVVVFLCFSVRNPNFITFLENTPVPFFKFRPDSWVILEVQNIRSNQLCLSHPPEKIPMFILHYILAVSSCRLFMPFRLIEADSVHRGYRKIRL